MQSEFIRLLSNLCQVGTITQVKSADGLALARVKIDDLETDFFPVVSRANSFKRHFIPLRVGEQVTVFCPFGEASFGIVIPSLFNKSCKEPSGSSENREVVEYEDGTIIFYDTKAKELNIKAVGEINIVCKKATIIADTLDITANTTINGTLSVSKNIKGSGGLNISGGNGAIFDGNINVSGDITDKKGSLTNHTNHGYGRD